MSTYQKTLCAAAAIFCSLCFFVTSVIVYKSGIVPGINAAADEERKNAEIAINISDTIEGIFLDRNNEKITKRSKPGKPAVAVYPESFSHIIGYNSTRLGVSGLRKTLYNDIFNGGEDKVGADVKLTIDAQLQETAYNLIKESIGSISVIDAKTGEILALASSSSETVPYNVNLIDKVYKKKNNKVIFYSDLYNKQKNFWYNRAVFAQDPPGSCAKIITAASLVENHMEDFKYYDDGSELNGSIVNFEEFAYGNCDLQKALTYSINTYFAKAGLTIGSPRLKKTFNNFMIGKTSKLDFCKIETNAFTDNSDYTTASIAYGQGDLKIAPLNLAMTACAIMNEGKMMKPYIISDIENDKQFVYNANTELLSKACDKQTADTVKEMLSVNAQSYGLYKAVETDEDVLLAAKTGTAEYGKTNNHHIYYTVGVEYKGDKYGICVDSLSKNATGHKLQNIVAGLIKSVISMKG